jgi:hypothetical protein
MAPGARLVGFGSEPVVKLCDVGLTIIPVILANFLDPQFPHLNNGDLTALPVAVLKGKPSEHILRV